MAEIFKYFNGNELIEGTEGQVEVTQARMLNPNGELNPTEYSLERLGLLRLGGLRWLRIIGKVADHSSRIEVLPDIPWDILGAQALFNGQSGFLLKVHNDGFLSGNIRIIEHQGWTHTIKKVNAGDHSKGTVRHFYY